MTPVAGEEDRKQKLKGSTFPGVIFAKGCEFLLVSLGEGFEVGFRWAAGGCGFSCEK